MAERPTAGSIDEYIAERFDAFVARIHETVPRALLFYVAITPSRARWELWPVAQRANRLIEERVLANPRLRFIDLTGRLLDRDGLPDRTLYRSDGLHPSKRGYEVWAAAIRSALEKEPALTP